MSLTSTVQPPSTSGTEQGSLLRKALAGFDRPKSLSQILAAIPKAVRPTEGDATVVIRQEVQSGRLFEFPSVNGKAQFWCHGPSEYARRSLHQNLERGAKRQSDVIRDVKNLTLLRTMSKAEIERIFASMLQEGVIYKWPSLLGAKSHLFGVTQAEPAEYLKDALSKLSKKLNLSEAELIRCYTLTSDSTNAPETEGPTPAQIHDDRVMEAMRELDPNVDTGAMISIADLRDALAMQFTEEEFNQALLAESAAGRIALHPFDRPFLVSETERNTLLCDGNDNYYNTVSLRRT